MIQLIVHCIQSASKLKRNHIITITLLISVIVFSSVIYEHNYAINSNTNKTNLTQTQWTVSSRWMVGYRLSDMTKNNPVILNKWNGEEYHRKYFPNSIAVEYLNKTNKSQDLNTLISILHNRQSAHISPPNNSLVVHLRIGDVIDNVSASVNDFLQYYIPWPRSGRYNVMPISYYQIILNSSTFPTYLTKVILVGGFHSVVNHSKSLKYVEKIKQFFEANNYNFETQLRINGNPDTDFIFMCNSKHFVQSGGGFSRLISQIVQLKGGNVYEYNAENNWCNPRMNQKVLVKTPNGPTEGIVKFIGLLKNVDRNNKNTTRFTPRYIGIVLNKPNGNNNGIYKGYKYFKCPPNHGIMIPRGSHKDTIIKTC